MTVWVKGGLTSCWFSSALLYAPLHNKCTYSFVDLLCFCSVLCLLCFVRVCLYVLRGHLLGKGWPLGSRLWCLLWVCHFPIGILGQVWYLIVSIPDLCNLTYFVSDDSPAFSPTMYNIIFTWVETRAKSELRMRLVPLNMLKISSISFTDSSKADFVDRIINLYFMFIVVMPSSDLNVKKSGPEITTPP